MANANRLCRLVLSAILVSCTGEESGSEPSPAGMGGAGGDGGTSTGGVPASGGVGGAGATIEPSGGDGDAGSVPGLRLPPANAGLDYQLGGAYEPPEGVGIVSRDRTDAPAPGLYNICYVNGFQAQPGEEGLWASDLILRDANGDPVIDPDWNELLLDVSTADKRSRIAEVLGGWIQQCAADGFDAVEIDNLDTYSRSGGRITEDHAVALMALLSEVAHRAGLAAGQKNSTELLGRRAEMGTDFAVAEECSAWSECEDYIATYGEHVLMIEYGQADFAEGCASHGATHSIVLRDLNLVTPGNAAYVYDGC